MRLTFGPGMLARIGLGGGMHGSATTVHVYSKYYRPLSWTEFHGSGTICGLFVE